MPRHLFSRYALTFSSLVLVLACLFCLKIWAGEEPSLPKEGGEEGITDIVSSDHKVKVYGKFFEEIKKQLREWDMEAWLREKGDEEGSIRLLVLELKHGENGLDLRIELQTEIQEIAREKECLVLIEDTNACEKLDMKLNELLKYGDMINERSLPEYAHVRTVFNSALLGGLEYTEHMLGASLQAKEVRIVDLESGEQVWALESGNGKKTLFEHGITNRKLYFYMGICGSGFLALIVLGTLLVSVRKSARRRKEEDVQRAIKRQLNADKSFRNKTAERLAHARNSLGLAIKTLPPGDERAVRINATSDEIAGLEAKIRDSQEGIATRLAATPFPDDLLDSLARVEGKTADAVEKAAVSAKKIEESAATGDTDAVIEQLLEAKENLGVVKRTMEERNRTVSGA